MTRCQISWREKTHQLKIRQFKKASVEDDLSKIKADVVSCRCLGLNTRQFHPPGRSVGAHVRRPAVIGGAMSQEYSGTNLIRTSPTPRRPVRPEVQTD